MQEKYAVMSFQLKWSERIFETLNREVNDNPNGSPRRVEKKTPFVCSNGGIGDYSSTWSASCPETGKDRF